MGGLLLVDRFSVGTVYQVVTPTLKNQLSMLVFLKPVTPGCLPLNHSAFLNSMAAPAFELGSEEP